MYPMATAMGQMALEGRFRSPVRGGIRDFVVVKRMGPDAAPGGATLENSFVLPPPAAWRRGLKDVAVARLETGGIYWVTYKGGKPQPYLGI
jgi:hypothetical protein